MQAPGDRSCIPSPNRSLFLQPRHLVDVSLLPSVVSLGIVGTSCTKGNLSTNARYWSRPHSQNVCVRWKKPHLYAVNLEITMFVSVPFSARVWRLDESAPIGPSDVSALLVAPMCFFCYSFSRSVLPDLPSTPQSSW